MSIYRHTEWFFIIILFAKLFLASVHKLFGLRHIFVQLLLKYIIFYKFFSFSLASKFFVSKHFEKKNNNNFFLFKFSYIYCTRVSYNSIDQATFILFLLFFLILLYFFSAFEFFFKFARMNCLSCYCCFSFISFMVFHRSLLCTSASSFPSLRLLVVVV